MIDPNYPSPVLPHRRADLAVHVVALVLILAAGGMLVFKAASNLEPKMVCAVLVYILCVLASNLASCAYHFAPWHTQRVRLRRLDHAAIYTNISGTFTPLLIQANTVWTLNLLWICWVLTAFAVWQKMTAKDVKARWSTASYLGLGAIGLSALPDFTNISTTSIYFIIGGAFCYTIGTAFYARKAMPFRYSIWHLWVNSGGIMMFFAVWYAIL